MNIYNKWNDDDVVKWNACTHIWVMSSRLIWIGFEKFEDLGYSYDILKY